MTATATMPRDWSPAFPASFDADAARIIRRDHTDGVYEVALISRDGREVEISAYLVGEDAAFSRETVPFATMVAAFAAPYAACALGHQVVTRFEQGRI